MMEEIFTGGAFVVALQAPSSTSLRRLESASAFSGSFDSVYLMR